MNDRLPRDFCVVAKTRSPGAFIGTVKTNSTTKVVMKDAARFQGKTAWRRLLVVCGAKASTPLRVQN